MSTEPSSAHMSKDHPIACEAQRIQAQGFLKRKGRLQDLFIYLVGQSSQDLTTSEMMIAADVFGRTDFTDKGDDATVRVYVHRLRTRLAEHYRAYPSAEGALSLPKGEYRLALMTQANTSDDEALDNEHMPSQPSARSSTWLYFALGLVLLNIAAWAYLRPASSEAEDLHPIWDAFEQTVVPTVIVVGDYYIYQPAPFADAPQQLIRDFSINSAQDLEEAQLNYPDSYAGSQNIDLHYLPVSTAYALAKLSPQLNQSISNASREPGALGAAPIKVMQASDVTAATLKNYNVVYVGLFSGLNYLSRPVFEDSFFVKGQTYDQIVDLETGITYDSSEVKNVTIQTEYLDYGYYGQFEGPGGNLLTIIAGTRDTGLQGVSDILAAPLGAEAKDTPWADRSHIEALYEVRGEDRENLRQTLIANYSK